jgi:hypothetical protein
MTETKPRPFDGFIISHQTEQFEVVCHDIQLFRQWRTGLLSNEKPEFLTSSHGHATGADDVCIFETGIGSRTFDLAVYSDQKIKESWEDIKGNELVVDNLVDHERRRIRNLQYERFDKSPPTATLFYSGGFSLECKIPMPVLEQLSSDLVAQNVDAVRIRIEWSFAFNDKLSGAWGFFRDGQLRGHISSFTWSSPEMPRSKA